MTDIEYCGYNFTQNPGTDKYRVRDKDGKIVESSWEKPDMTMEDAIRIINRYILVRELMNQLVKPQVN